MTLRTTAMIAGVIGALMVITGVISNALKADDQVVVTAPLDSPVLVLGADVLALPGIEKVAVTAEGGIQAHTARPVDANAWLLVHPAQQFNGFLSWDELDVRAAAPTQPSPDASPSPSASASPGASASPSPSPSASPSPSPSATASPSPSASASPEPTDDGALTEEERAELVATVAGPQDHWREDWSGDGRLALVGTRVAPGESLVFFTEDGAPLTALEVTATRQVNDRWIPPMIWIGAALALLGLAAAVSALVDLRPAQARVESWLSSRRGAASDAPPPGSRRERRLTAAVERAAQAPTKESAVGDGALQSTPDLDFSAEAAEAAGAAEAAEPVKAKRPTGRKPAGNRADAETPVTAEDGPAEASTTKEGGE